MKKDLNNDYNRRFWIDFILCFLVNLFIVVLVFLCLHSFNFSILAETWKRRIVFSRNISFIGILDNLGEMYYTQVSTSFIIISLVSVLSSTSKIVYWVDVSQYKLVEPKHFSFVDITAYVISCLFVSTIGLFLNSRYIAVPFVISIILMAILTYKMIGSYFAKDSVKKDLENEFKKLKQKQDVEFNDVLVKLISNTYKAVDQKDIDIVLQNMDLLRDNKEYEDYFEILEYIKNCLPGVYGDILLHTGDNKEKLDQLIINEADDGDRYYEHYYVLLSEYLNNNSNNRACKKVSEMLKIFSIDKILNALEIIVTNTDNDTKKFIEGYFDRVKALFRQSMEEYENSKASGDRNNILNTIDKTHVILDRIMKYCVTKDRHDFIYYFLDCYEKTMSGFIKNDLEQYKNDALKKEFLIKCMDEMPYYSVINSLLFAIIVDMLYIEKDRHYKNEYVEVFLNIHEDYVRLFYSIHEKETAFSYAKFSRSVYDAYKTRKNVNQKPITTEENDERVKNAEKYDNELSNNNDEGQTEIWNRDVDTNKYLLHKDVRKEKKDRSCDYDWFGDKK